MPVAENLTFVESDLPPRHQKLLAALLSARTVEAAAGAAGCSVRHAYRMLADPVFAEALRKARRAALRLATGQLQQSAGEAVMVLRLIAADKGQPASARVAAASRLLDTAFKAAEIEDLEARLAAVEERLTASGAPGGMNGCRTAGAW